MPAQRLLPMKFMTPSNVIENRNLPAPVNEWLRICSISTAIAEKCSMETKLYHDLGFYGDIAESYIEVLVEHFEVDMSEFEFERYFPLEFPSGPAIYGFLITYVPFFRYFLERPSAYLPLPLSRIYHAIKDKKWRENYEIYKT
jgi:hypothetical protein